MDLAPFARMDNPITLSAVSQPGTRLKFNQDESDDDDKHENPLAESTISTHNGVKVPASEAIDLNSPSSFFASLDGEGSNAKSSVIEGEESKQNDEIINLPADTQNGTHSNYFSEPSTPSKSQELAASKTNAPNMSPLRESAVDASPSFNTSPVKESTNVASSLEGGPATPKDKPSSAVKRSVEEAAPDSASPAGVSGSASAMAQRNKTIEPGVFWAEHREWLHSLPPVSFVSVDEPLQMARSLTNPNPPFTYLVKTDFCSDGVRRRYSDFEMLRAYLAPRYPGILILALPEKKTVGANSSEFLRVRAKGLQMFLRVLLENEFFRGDGFVRSFLQASPSEWETLKKRATSAQAPAVPIANLPTKQAQGGAEGRSPVQSPSLLSISATAEERWRAAVQMSILPDNYEEEIRKMADLLSRLEMGLKSLVAAASKCVSTSQQYALAVKDMHRQFAFTLSSVQSSIEFWSDASSIETVLLEEVLLDALELELELCAEMKRMLEQRKELVGQADQKLAILHKYEDEREQLEKSGQADRAQRSAQKVQDAQKQVKQADYKLETMTRAMFLSGLRGFAAKRIESISSVLGQFAFGELRFGDLMKSVWLGVVASLRLDMNLIEQQAEAPLSHVRRRIPEKFGGMFRTQAGPHPTSPKADSVRAPASSPAADTGGPALLSV